VTIGYTLCFLWASVLFYVFAFGFGLFGLYRKGEYRYGIFYTLLAGGFFLQTLGLYFRGVYSGTFPLNNPMELLQMITWSCVFLVVILRVAFQLKTLGFFASGFAALLGAISLYFQIFNDLSPKTSPLTNPWVDVHIGLAVFSYGFFSILALVSLMYLFQDYGLTYKRFRGLFALLPSLKQLLDLGQRLLLMGLICLSLSLMMGTLIWFESAIEIAPLKMIVAGALWVAYLSMYWTSRTASLSPRYFAWLSIFLFFLALLSLAPTS